MKSIFYLFAILITTGINAQSNYTATVMNNSNGDVVQLEKLPWDQSKLVQVKRIYDPSSNTNNFTLEEVSTGVNNPISIPLSLGIKSKPTFVDDGMLFSGKTSSDGIECLFYDGVSTTVFDLNPGVGDSEPVVYFLQDRIFLIAHDGIARQLYEFDKVTHVVTKITNGTTYVKRVCAVWGESIYYQTRAYNSVTAGFDYVLMKVSLGGSVASYSSIRSISVTTNPINQVLWRSPQLKWGKLYLTEDTYSPLPWELSDLSIISIDENDQIVTVHEDLQTYGGYSNLFEWEDALWSYGSSTTQLYKSTDGVSFSQEVDAGVNEFTDHHISENNKLYFNLHDTVAEIDEIVVFYGSLQTLHSGEDLNFLLEENNILYLSDSKDIYFSSIVLMHTNYDITEEVDVALGSHPLPQDASVMFDNEFTFLFKYNQTNIDVLKLTGSPQAGLPVISKDLLIYPNPVEATGVLTIDSEVEGEFQIYASDNRIVANGSCQMGVNKVEISSLRSGMYFLAFNGMIHQIIII